VRHLVTVAARYNKKPVIENRDTADKKSAK
jgi:hypothetical protein